MQTIYIGYWNNHHNQYPHYPFPVARKVNNASDVAKLEKVLSYTTHTIAYRGISKCRICEMNLGNEEHVIELKKIKIHIPSGYMHYVKHHGVELDPKLDMFLDGIASGKIQLPKLPKLK